MPTLRFDAWVNARDLAHDPGHMGMLDIAGGFYYELAMGAALKEGQPYFGHSVTSTDVRSGEKYAAATKSMVLKKTRKEEYFRTQLLKTAPSSTTFRFTHLYYIEPGVSDDEYRYLMAITLTQGLCGVYNFLGEAWEADALIARCRSPIDFLAHMRDFRLNPGTPLQAITQFGNRFGVPVRQDDLIAY